MKRFIVTEEEKKHIMNLYEETTTKLPEIIRVNLNLTNGPVSGATEYFVEISEVMKKSTNCEFIGNFRGKSKKFKFIWTPTDRLKLSFKKFDVSKGEEFPISLKFKQYTGTISEKAAKLLENACENKKFVSTEKGDSSNYV